MKKTIFKIITILSVLIFVFILSVNANQTEVKAVEGFSKEEPLSYSVENFYIYGINCGKGSDSYGRKCKKGIYIAKGLTCSILHLSCE